MSKPSKKDVNADKVSEYLNGLTVEEYPVNAAGEINWSKISKELNISRSSNQTNDRIVELLENANSELSKKPRFSNTPKRSNDEVKMLEIRISQLENKVAVLSTENSLLKCELKGIDFFCEHRRMVR